MRNDTLKRTTVLPLMVLAVTLFAIYGKSLRQEVATLHQNANSTTASRAQSLAASQRSNDPSRVVMPPIYGGANVSGSAQSLAAPSATSGALGSGLAARSQAPSTLSTLPLTLARADQRESQEQGPEVASRNSDLEIGTVASTQTELVQPSEATTPEAPRFNGPLAGSTSGSETAPATTNSNSLLQQVAEQLELVTDAPVQSQQPSASYEQVRAEAERISALLVELQQLGIEYPVVLSQETQSHFYSRLSKAQGLVRKGALFAAEQELNEALLDFARDLDAIGPRRDHVLACQFGLQAMREASDFYEATQQSNDRDRVRLIAQRHATFRAMFPDVQEVNQEMALEAYYSVALTLLSHAAGGQPLAAEAYVTLGKLHAIAPNAGLQSLGPFQAGLPVPKSLVYHQVALRVHPGHAVAANELAVQVGRLGQWSVARDLLQQSLRSRPSPEAWHNLAEAHLRLGEVQYAELARQEAAILQQGMMVPAGTMPAANPQLANRFMVAPQQSAPQQETRSASQNSGVPFFAGVR